MLLLFALSVLLKLSSCKDLPTGAMGFYVLIADDTVSGYTSTSEWQPFLYDYELDGTNVLWLTFINPNKMPAVPPAMANLAMCKGSGKAGCPSASTPVIFSIGGEAYSKGAWSWLASESAAEAMAAEVATWDTKYGADGVDLDIEGAAGNAAGAGSNLVAFAKKLKSLNPNMYITQPVYGYPQITAENVMVNNGWTKDGNSLGLIDSVGLMVYNGLECLQYVKDYGNATSEWDGFPIHVDVPYKNILCGIQGSAGGSTITQLATDVKKQGLGGIMVWFASVYDATRHKPALSYGSMDATRYNTTTGADWKQAMQIMQ